MKDKDYLDKEKLQLINDVILILEKSFKKKLSEGDYPSITMSIQSRLAMDSHDEEYAEETFEEWLSKFDSYDEEYDVPMNMKDKVVLGEGVDAADVLNLRTEEEIINNTSVHAKWLYGVIVEEIEIRNETYQFKTPGYFCSCCKGDALENGDEQMLTKYCPHCGAKMENGEDYR